MTTADTGSGVIGTASPSPARVLGAALASVLVDEAFFLDFFLLAEGLGFGVLEDDAVAVGVADGLADDVVVDSVSSSSVVEPEVLPFEVELFVEPLEDFVVEDFSAATIVNAGLRSV